MSIIKSEGEEEGEGNIGAVIVNSLSKWTSIHSPASHTGLLLAPLMWLKCYQARAQASMCGIDRGPEEILSCAKMKTSMAHKAL